MPSAGFTDSNGNKIETWTGAGADWSALGTAGNASVTTEVQPPAPVVGDPNLRFPVGTKVICNCGPEGWLAGTIVLQNYSEESANPNWPAGKKAPYQVVSHTHVFSVLPPTPPPRLAPC